MSEKYLIVAPQEQVPPYEPEAMTQGLLGHLGLFLAPLILPLDRVMDKRLLRTFVQTAHAPAGTKRLSRLLHSPRWQAEQIDAFGWQQASQQVEALAIWDSSEWEKPETDDNEDLCAVRSSKGQRLTPIKPGYFTPPGGPFSCLAGIGLGWCWLASRRKQDCRSWR